MATGGWIRRHNWVPLVFLIISLLLVAWLGLVSRANHAQRFELETQIIAEQLKIRLESCFDTRAGLVRTLASFPWRSREQLLADWSNRASSLLPLYTGVQALNYVDPAGVIRVVYPLETNRPALNANLLANPNPSVVSALQEARADETLTRTNVVELLQSGRGFALYQQILSEQGQLMGFANGVFRVDSLMESCLPEGNLSRNFALSLSDNGDVFYERGEKNVSALSSLRVELPVDVTGLPWAFAIAPLRSYLDEGHGLLEEIWPVVGVLLIILLTLALRSILLKQTEIAESEDKYRLLVENQTDMVVKVNPAGEFQYISPSYCEVFGKSEDELLGHQFMPLVHEEDRELTHRSLESLLQPPHSSYHEQRAMTKDGWRWIAWSNRAIFDEAGELEAITAVGRDVTEVKRLEQSIAHSQKMRAMGELAGGITHDFNNLLQVIIGNIDFVLLEDAHDQSIRDSLMQVRNVAERAVGLTEKLATLSRQDISRPESFDINEYVGELNELLLHTLPASVELSVATADDPLPVFVDKSQLEQALLNLFFNARDAIESKGRIKITTARRTMDRRALESHPELAPGDYVEISVHDDGPGIEPEIMPRIFDPFFTTKGTQSGSGLGLANCYSIIEQHKGFVKVDSTPGSGTRFSVFLPLADTTEMLIEPDKNSLREKSPAAGRVALVADDNPEIVNLTRMVLEKNGFQTLTAADGREAFEIYESHKDSIQLVILDLVMPEMGGQEVAARVRELSGDVAILLVSGFIPEDVQKTLDEPIIKKPYTINAFMEAVNQLLSQEPGSS